MTWVSWVQKDEPEKAEPEEATTPAREQKPEANAGALQISLDLAGQKKIDLNAIMLNSPEQPKTSSSEEEEWLDVETGQPASVSKVNPSFHPGINQHGIPWLGHNLVYGCCAGATLNLTYPTCMQLICRACLCRRRSGKSQTMQRCLLTASSRSQGTGESARRSARSTGASPRAFALAASWASGGRNLQVEEQQAAERAPMEMRMPRCRKPSGAAWWLPLVRTTASRACRKVSQGR